MKFLGIVAVVTSIGLSSTAGAATMPPFLAKWLKKPLPVAAARACGVSAAPQETRRWRLFSRLRMVETASAPAFVPCDEPATETPVLFDPMPGTGLMDQPSAEIGEVFILAGLESPSIGTDGPDAAADPAPADPVPADPVPVVPLPASMPLLLAGVGALALAKRRRKV